MEKGQASDLLQALKDLLANYQKAVRVARHKYVLNVIAKSKNLLFFLLLSTMFLTPLIRPLQRYPQTCVKNSLVTLLLK